MKSGFIGIAGRPNVGKSTLMNAIVGEKVAITSNKAQTTRNAIRGIYTDDEYQLIFIDTPGIHKPRNRLGAYLTNTAVSTLSEVDVVLFLTDSALSEGPGDRYILDLLKKVDKTPKILIINKIDLIDPEEYRQIYNEYEDTGIFDEILGVCAVNGLNTDICVDKIKRFIKEGPMYFPKDMFTDNPMRFLVSEIIREKALLYLNDEIPHGVAVEIEEYGETERCTNISAVIYCEKASHKGIIIGSKGKKLKGIGKAARLEIEPLTGGKVFLKIWVKVKPNWRENDVAISNFGYTNDR